jgi:hypothetical protein
MRGKLAGASHGRSVRFFTTIMQIMFILLLSQKKNTEWQTFRSISKQVFFSLSRTKVVSMQNLGQSLCRTSENNMQACMQARKQGKKKERKKASSEVSPGGCALEELTKSR